MPMPEPFSRSRSPMHASRRSSPFSGIGPCLLLLSVLLATLWLAGGASRADALGQVVVRTVAWIVLVVAILFVDRPRPGAGTPALVRPVAILLAVIVALPLIQLVPLPPAIWQALPGRAMLAEAAAASGQAQPWRAMSIVPGATVNAASSLIVPVVVLLLLAAMTDEERAWLPGIVLGMIGASTAVGLLQFSGAGFNNPFINETVGQVGGTFANRNHFALFLALGCLIAPCWAVLDGRSPRWRGPVALGLVLLLVLVILATGSRAGIILGAAGLAIGLFLSRKGIRRTLRRYPRWVYPALLAGIVAVVAILVLVSVMADRAVSIDRFLSDQGQDMRSRGLPTVLAMIGAYFPAGSGLGSFDPIFRIHEPFALLKPTYFNHAHNDFLEIILDAGIPGLAVLLAAIGWWGMASVRAWRAAGSAMLPCAGSAMILLVLLSSAIDYPVRTPLMMAVVTIAAVWLAGACRSSALPATGQHL